MRTRHASRHAETRTTRAGSIDAMRLPLIVAAAVLGASCMDLVLPPDFANEPGEVTLTVLVQQPGRAELQAAPNATLTLVGTSQQSRADADGNIRLTGLTSSTGVLRLSWDADEDGVEDAARLFDLQTIGAGFGRRVSLGIVVLGRLASVQGRVRRGGREPSTGHAGILVFVPSSPSSTVTSDDGSYVLSGLPEGSLPISFFANGYAPASSRVSVTAGQTLRLADVTLDTAPPAESGRIRGTVRSADGAPLPAVTVTVDTGSQQLTAQTDSIGAYSITDVPGGLVNLVFVKTGFVSVRIPNFLVQAGVSTQDATLTAGVDVVPPVVVDAGTVDAGLGDAGTIDAGPGDAGTPDAGPAAPPVLRGAGPVPLTPITLPDGGYQLFRGTAALEGDLDFVLLKLGMGTEEIGDTDFELVYGATNDSEQRLRFLERRASRDGGRPLETGGVYPISAVVLTYANATRARVSFSRPVSATASPSIELGFPSVRARPGDLVLNVNIASYSGDTCTVSDGGIPFTDVQDFQFIALSVPDAGVTAPVPVTCSLSSGATLMQFVLSNAP